MKAADARVLLTGAGGGIGDAMARALLARGAAVLLVGRSAERLAAQAGRLGGRGVEWVRADLTTDDGIAAVAAAAQAFRANVVVHAAGVPGFGAFEHLPAAQMADVIQTNLLAPMRLTQALLPQLRRRARAQLVFVGSAVGAIGLPGFAVYGASKAGLQRFAEALRRELADTPVRVQLLGPRSTRTPFNDASVEAYNDATRTAMDTPEQVADALVALIESEAAERWLGSPERYAVRLNGLLGPALDGSFVRHRRSLPAPALQPAPEGTPR